MPRSSSDAVLRSAIIETLVDAPDGLSLAKLSKRLGVRMSVLLRALAWMGEAPIGDISGEGLVRVDKRGDLWIATLICREQLIVDKKDGQTSS